MVEHRLAQLAQSHEPTPAQTPVLTQDHELIRDASVYGEFFRAATQTPDISTQSGVVDDHVHA
jgi:hypothetical protein